MKKIAIRKRPLALQDIEDIIAYIAEDSPQAAKRFRNRLEECIEDIAIFPDSGRSRESLLKGVRTIPVGNYLIVYQNHTTHIDIIRVLHGARNIESLF